MSGELNSRDSGPADAPVLLLIHAMGADLSFWDECRPAWEGTHRCVAMDLPNSGMSRKTGSPLSIEDQAAELEVFRQAKRLGRVVPVGCAVGAMVAAVYAGLYSHNCDGLVLSNPGHHTLPEARGLLAKRAADVRSGGLAAIMPGVIDGAFFGRPMDERRERFHQRFVMQDPEAYARQIEGMLDADISPYLAAITFPTLIVAGENDRLLPPAHAQKIHEALPTSEFVTVRNGAHFIPYQQPDEFAQLVRSFLERL